MTTKQHEVDDENPPAYDISTTSNELDGTTTATSDGRVDIDLDSKLARTLALVTRLPEQSDYSNQPPPAYTDVVWQTRLNIVIQVVGSRGDVQPFLALGNGLQRYGHRVRIATHDTFRDFVRQANLEFYPIGGNPTELMAFMVKNPGLIPKMKSLREGEISKKRQMIREMLFGCWNSCFKSDPETDEPFVANAIIANPPSFAHVHCAQALGIPVHIMFTMPWSPTQSFPHPLARLRPSNVGQGMANYLSYGLVQALTWQGLADIINNFRKSVDLEPVPYTEGPFLSETLNIPHTYCWSPSLVPRPTDWPEHIDVCGFFFRSSPDYKPFPGLQDFLAQGQPPIYIGFGSIVLDDPDNITDTIVEAVKLSGARAIVSAGWSKLGSNRQDKPENIFFLDQDCPHEWLFPRVAAVVHHGGAGTTACGLVNGRPTLVVPFFGDQFFWGDMIAVAGAGPQSIRHQDLSPENLSAAIRFCLTPQASLKAATIAEGIQKENGVAAAVASFHRNLPATKLPCTFDPTSPAIWTYEKAGKQIKLSGAVAETLIKQEKIKPKNLNIYHPQQYNITNTRWEPNTAVISAMTGTSLNILSAANSLWKAPYDMRKRNTLDPSHTGGYTSKEIAAMVGGSAMGIPRIYGAMLKGFLLDLPLAVTEGLRQTPKLYGEEVRPRDVVSDWKSGGVVAGKTFTEGMRDAAMGLYTSPAEGLEKEGIVGLGKGIGKGLIGSVTKSGAAAIGLIAYPAEGLSKSIHTAFHAGTRKMIAEARKRETAYRVEREGRDELVEAEWLMRFDEMFGSDSS